MSTLFDLSGKIALVTGATRGIGRGVVDRLAEHAAKVVVSSRSPERCEEVATELNQRYGGGDEIAVGIPCDIESLDDIERLAGLASEKWGGLDILVANAAALPFMGPSADTPPEMFDRILSTNQHHNFRLCQAVRPSMARRGGGSIVLIGSISGHTPAPTTMAYSIAKAGLAHMARCLADEFACDGIRVNNVAPGLIRSHSSRYLWQDESMLAKVTADIPLQRIGEPEDIAGAVVFLSSTAGSYVTGVTIPVDGGRLQLSPAGATSAVDDATEAGKTFD